MQPVSECPKKARLRRLCQAYLLTYWEAMHRLDHVSSHCEFEETHERAEGVRLLFEEARTELHRQIEQHGCELLEAVPAIIAKWRLQELDGPLAPSPRTRAL